jgi:hypothetical protein
VRRRFKNLAKHTLKACLGAENLYRTKNIYDRIRFQLLYPEDYKPIKKSFDVLFFCPLPRLWNNITTVLEELIHKRDDLKLGIVTWWRSREEFPSPLYFKDNLTIINERAIISPPQWRLNLFNTRILYTMLPLSPFDRPPNASVVHALMSMNSAAGEIGVRLKKIEKAE